MKITDKTMDNRKLFKELKLSDVFKYGKSIMIKVSYAHNGHNAYDLTNTTLTYIPESELVQTTSAELTLYCTDYA